METFRLSAILACSLLFISCMNEFLEIKPDKKQVVPSELRDIQALLDNTEVMNTNFPSLGEISSDNLHISERQWDLVYYVVYDRNAYLWRNDIYEGQPSTSGSGWWQGYQQVYYANVALETLEKLSDEAPLSGEPTRENIKGSALFFRGLAFFQLAQLFCDPYESATAVDKLGIPIRLDSDLEKPVVRSTIEQSYNQIIFDLTTSAALLPENSTVKTRPSKTAAYGLLARVFLAMGKYEQALNYADSCLEIQNELMDYATLDTGESFPIKLFNEEVIFHSTLAILNINLPGRYCVTPSLYESYDKTDYRRKAFFNDATGNDGEVWYKGSYDGSNTWFSGIATDEIYLIRAECMARMGRTDQAAFSLNTLLAHRYESLTDVNTDIDQETILNLVLSERRKELVFRGVRWSDLRRLNKDSRFSETLTRALNGQEYELLPNDKRYTLPIPVEVINRSGIPQNER